MNQRGLTDSAVAPCSIACNSRSFSLKILFLSRSLEWGGAERQLVALASQLAQRDFDVTIAVFYPKQHLNEGLEGTGVRVLSLDKTGRWDLLGFTLRLLRLVRTEQPQVLHSYLTGPNVITAILKVFYPSVRLVWGVRASSMDLTRYDRTARIAARIENRLARIPDLIICNSQSGYQAAAQRGFPTDRLCVIRNGIDTDRFAFNKLQRHQIRKQWGITEEATLIGLVGRLDPMKGISTFLLAAQQAAEQNANLHFVCIGRGMLSLRSKETSDRIHFYDAADDMPAVYSALDMVCSSSSYGEGFSNVIAEAMSCQRPCVVTDVGDSAWIVGDSGTTVRPEDPAELAQAILAMAASDLAALGVAARKRVIDLFGLEKLGAETALVLNRLTDSS